MFNNDEHEREMHATSNTEPTSAASTTTPAAVDAAPTSAAPAPAAAPASAPTPAQAPLTGDAALAPTSAVANPAKKIAVIDGNSLMHRAYHAVPPTMNAPDGTPTNAVFGFMSMLLKFIEVSKPDGIVCAFDMGKPQFRIEALEQYKAQRPPMDNELRVQFPLIESLLESMNIPVVKVKGWEGDDILGTVAARNEARGYETLLVTGDKDACQLASDLTRIVNTKKGITDVVIYDPAGVYEKYGVTPAQIPDYLGLMGDSSDNIPGVPGVGPKTASKFLQDYGSIEGLYDNLDKLKGKTLEKVRDNKELAFLSRQIATIVTDLDFPLDVDDVRFPDFDTEKVINAFDQIKFTSHLDRLFKLVGVSGGSSSAQIEPSPILRGDDAKDLVDRAIENGIRVGVSFAEVEQASLFGQSITMAIALCEQGGGTEHSEQDGGIALCEQGEGTALCEQGGGTAHSDGAVQLDNDAPTNDDAQVVSVAVLEGDDAIGAFVNLVRKGKLATLDLKAAFQKAFPKDSGEEAILSDADLSHAVASSFASLSDSLNKEESIDEKDLPRAIDEKDLPRAIDLGLASYVLNSSASKHSMDSIVENYLSASLPETKDEVEAAAIEAQAAAMLTRPMVDALVADASTGVYFNIDLPLVATLTIIERCGMPIDKKQLKELGDATQIEIDDLRSKIYELAGEEFNVDSPKQLSHILFEVMHLPHGKKTKSGYSTDAKVLGKLAADHEIASCVLRYREFAKIKSTYIDALPRLAADYADGRVHTTFNETVTTTGRLSSSDPNLQNIPVRTEFGRKIRACFGALNPGDLFVSADYSQIELRLLAHLSEDENLIAAFKSGEDFHAATAARVFGVEISDVTSEMRSRAKAVNFGIVYGQQAFGLGQSLGIPMREAQEFIDRYYAAYPRVRTYLDETVEEAKERGYAVTMFGRKRHIPELKAKNAVQRGFGERTAMNHPMQGSAADIIKLAMVEVQRRLDDEGFGAKLMVQVHDELDFSCPPNEIDRLSAMVKDVMENAASLRVPLIADVQHASTWADAH